MTAKVLMVQGCTSDAGKSTLVAGLCRVLARRGADVVPFKPQNMALNSAVAADGGEIARSTWLQALAARAEPHTDMNPVLLKPSSDIGAQVIVHGRALAQMDAQAYHDYKRTAQAAVQQSFARLRARHGWIVVEGAGSPAEVNLREGDIANMGFALPHRVPVVLAADIDRGGVFAHFVGTLACLSADEQALVKGFIVNRFRGDLALLTPGNDWLAARTGKPVFGTVPYLQGLQLDAEDAIERAPAAPEATQRLRVAVPVLPRISNHTDFDALRAHPQVELHWVGPGQPLPACDLIVLPGSKSVQHDLAWLRAEGHDHAIERHLRYGGKLIGLCGGLQMLGRALHDPHGLEGGGSAAGLGWLDLGTTLLPDKQLRNVRGRLAIAEAAVQGYEIHQGVSDGPGLARPALWLEDGRPEGAVSPDGQVLGTYVHGLFDAPEALAALLRWAGLSAVQPLDRAALREASLERLADTLESALDLEALLACAS